MPKSTKTKYSPKDYSTSGGELLYSVGKKGDLNHFKTAALLEKVKATHGSSGNRSSIMYVFDNSGRKITL